MTVAIEVELSDGAQKAIDVPINPYEIAAYDDALWITCLADGRIARVTGLDG